MKVCKCVYVYSGRSENIFYGDSVDKQHVECCKEVSKHYMNLPRDTVYIKGIHLVCELENLLGTEYLSIAFLLERPPFSWQKNI